MKIIMWPTMKYYQATEEQIEKGMLRVKGTGASDVKYRYHQQNKIIR